MTVLVSGSSSGLGAYLKDHFQATPFDRSINQPAETIPDGGYSTIIHCAFSGNVPEGMTEEDYYAQNLKLAETLLALPHEHFVFISSVDVLAPELNAYAKSKLQVEELVQQKATNPLILRPGLLFGTHMRQGQAVRVLKGETGPFSLAANSTFTYLNYQDIAALIEKATAANSTGTWVVKRSCFTLSEAADSLSTQPQWGGYAYTTADVEPSAEAVALLPS